MGDPKRHRNKYKKPLKPWEAKRMGEESELINDYGLKNKKELWVAKSKIKRLRVQAKALIAATNEQAEKEKKQLLESLKRYKLLDSEKVEDVLSLDTKNILDKRLQTIVHSLALAKSQKHARQLIVHGHITVNGKKINAPSYMVLENDKIALHGESTESNREAHSATRSSLNLAEKSAVKRGTLEASEVEHSQADEVGQVRNEASSPQQERVNLEQNTKTGVAELKENAN